MRSILFGIAASFALVMNAPVQAQDNAGQQAQDIDHSSTDAMNSPSDEDAKNLSNQGFDTANTDPAPPPEPSSSPN